MLTIDHRLDTPERTMLLQCYAAALTAVEGGARVRDWLRQQTDAGPVHAIAIGKAASAMLHGAVAGLGERLADGLVITRHGYDTPIIDPHIPVTSLTAGHPLPDAASLAAGAALCEFIDATPDNANLLFLISGGTSSLVEVLQESVSLDDLIRINHWLLASGLPIDAMNAVRIGLSRIKGGRLLSRLGSRKSVQLLISDVPGDDVAVIGSGLLVPQSPSLPASLPGWIRALTVHAPAGETTRPPETHVIATLKDAMHAAADNAIAAGQTVHTSDTVLGGDAIEVGTRLAHALIEGPRGMTVWGGETTLQLPEHPGRGGRCQSLALAAAMAIRGRDDIRLLAAGTDGSDGPGEDAGALVDGGTLDRGELDGLDARDCLAKADAGVFLEASGDLLQTGPTGSNVMDLVIGYKA